MPRESRGSRVSRRRVLETLGAIGGGALAGCVTLDESPRSSSRDFAFEESTAAVGFDYASREDWIGHGHNGVYVNDFDNDLWPDVLAIGGAEPVLFENDEGTFRKSDALPEIDRVITGALFFDHDNDGREDLLLLAENDSPLFLKNVGGAYEIEDKGFEETLSRPVGAAAADYDRDGTLEVFVIQYGEWGEDVPEGYMNSGELEDDNGAPNYLYGYDGSTFERIGDAGIEGTKWSLATTFADFTGNAWPDIHVANDFNNDVLYVNQMDGTFDRRVLGSKTDRNAMSSTIADIDGDGRMDIFVTNIYLPIQEDTLTDEQYQLVRDRILFLLGKRIEGNNLLINRGDGQFVDEAEAYGVREGGWGWAAIVTDFDNDANPDIFHTTSIFFRIDRESPHYTYPMIWQGRGPDEEFVQHTGSDVGFAETSGRGAVNLDTDLDGRQDIAVATYAEEYVLYSNAIDAGNSIQIRPKSGPMDYSSIGTEVSVTVDGRRQHQILNSKADYQSQSSRYLHFGLGSAETVDRIAVRWPPGSELILEEVDANQRVVVTPEGIRRSTELG